MIWLSLLVAAIGIISGGCAVYGAIGLRLHRPQPEHYERLWRYGMVVCCTCIIINTYIQKASAQ